ncbi:MAG: HAD hydrolase family protein [Methylococcaceae bacterium]|nr:HAD hydrolase family protein [Methylococcaceae bacterium]MCI0667124.1 HAD hydrolase family protein [Methylococcaceae bacterium]MCI0734618.1 HAD hydrolase family protein [Methylococcaceae bacterium]
MHEILEKAKLVRLVIFDVDGVLTDGKLIFDESGREYKCFNTKDGHGIKMLRNSGVETAVISGRKSRAVSLRMSSLGVQHVLQGRDDKRAAFDELCAALSVSPGQVACVGDDLPDLPLFIRAGLAIAVADAHIAVRQRADWCTSLPGGCGAAREVCDLVMQAQQTLEPSISAYLTV